MPSDTVAITKSQCMTRACGDAGVNKQPAWPVYKSAARAVTGQGSPRWVCISALYDIRTMTTLPTDTFLRTDHHC